MRSNSRTTKKDETPAERAVARYDLTQATLEEFVHEPDVREILLELQRLVEDRNAALDAAGRAVKQQLLAGDTDKLVVGIFGAQKKTSRWYDGEYLAKTLDPEQSDQVLEEVVTYKVDVTKLDQLFRQGEIDPEVMRLARHEEAPTAAMMPGAPKPYVLPSVRKENGE